MEGMNSRSRKAHVHSKTEPLDLSPILRAKQVAKMETGDFPKTEAMETFGKAETTDFPKIFVKAEQLDLPKIEKLKPSGKTKPHAFPKTGQPEEFCFSKAKTIGLFGVPLIGFTFSDDNRKNLMLQLSRIRDFMRVMLSYPVKTVHDSKLKAWTRDASNRRLLIEDFNRLLNRNPLKCFQGFLPMSILQTVERGRTLMFGDVYGIPKAIFNLASNLAVDQLVQTLTCEDDHLCNIHHILLSARDGAEKRLVMEIIESVLKDKETVLRETFSSVLYIDGSVYKSQVEVHVRQQIAQQLQLPVEEGNEEWLKTSIEKEMSRKKYLVVLVDGDSEEPLDPRRVGFSEEELAGVVVFITTESSKEANDELTLAMDMNINTTDHLLPWKVFCQTTGNGFCFSSPAIQTIALRIVEECGGHLVAIVIVARSLKNVQDLRLWESALFKLRWPHLDCNNIKFHGQSRVMVNAFVYFIWFEISTLQKYCATRCLFIPNIKDGKLESELINDWISSRLVVAGEAEDHLRELMARFALLQFNNNESKYIQMPEDIYSILQSLNDQEPFIIKKSGLGLVQPPNSERWHNAMHIELANNKLSELPLFPNCLELKSLMLNSNADLTKLPSLFFSKMLTLCILDLSYTSVRELPNSFFLLQQLRELYMKSCERFMKLPSEVGQLKKLEKLDLDRTQIIHLPEEIQELTNLRSLILCFYEYCGKKSKQYTCSTIIPSKVISKLKQLKHLSIDVNPDDERWYENVQAVVPEILGLKQLLTLSLYIPHLELLKFIPAHNFELDFRFIVGRHMQRIILGTPSTWEAKFKQSECSLKFVNGDDIPSEIKHLVKHSKALSLERHKTIKNLSEFKMMNLEQLRVCMLAECREMQTIVDGRESNSGTDIFSHMLYLYVSHMKSLRNIWEGSTPPRCFLGMLKSLVLQNCPELTTVFTLDFLGNLSLLKELIVKDCPKITTLISDGSFKHKGEIYLCKLKKILLLHLPKLINISNGCQIGPSLESMAIYNCPKLQSLSKMEMSSQNLKVIKGETKWWDALQWSKEEWGIAYRPSMFDNIFSSINNQVDIMTQFGIDDDDIDDDPAGNMPLQPLSARIFKDPKQNADTNSRNFMPTWTKQIRLCPGTGLEVSLDDGYSWRKYGQKVILGAKFRRGYYRCTDRYLHGCMATKQVQRSDEDPTIIEVTYRGSHTCNNHLNKVTSLETKMGLGENHHHEFRKSDYQPQEEEKEEEEMEESVVTFFNFEEHKVNMEDLSPSFGFSSTSENQYMEN